MNNCGCVRCLAADRLRTLASVAEDVGDDSLADCLLDLARRTADETDQTATRMALAIVYGTVS
jgi:hypothetical protein